MTNWIPGAMSYPQWMQAEKFRKEISLDFSRTADRLIANSNQLDEISEKRLAKIAKLNRQDFESVTNALESFHADFNYKIGLVIQELEFQSEVLNSILYTLKNPLGTQVKELYNYGCQLIKEGLLSEAISKFKSALAIDNSSFLCHYQLGLLYLYGRNWSGSVINLDLANSHLLIACRLGKGKAQVNVSFYPIVANCYFAASLSFYFQLNNLNQVDNFKSSNDNYLLDQAIKCATSAIAYNNKLSQAHYHLAKFCFLKHQFDSSQQHLHNAIAHDKNYAVDAPNDKIFIRNNVEFHKILSRIKLIFTNFLQKNW
ncbi:MAG: hypothetical protein IPJ51_19675 [Saprospiraceae bacterium]|nr:hypothetical protein [Saprospiraceae bacterium]